MFVEIEYKAAHYSMSLNNLNSHPTQQLEGYLCVCVSAQVMRISGTSSRSDRVNEQSAVSEYLSYKL